MRTLIIIVLLAAVLVAAAAGYLVATTPRSGDPLRFPLDERQRDLLSRVPAGAEMFALAPAAGLLERKLLANRVAREAVQRWSEEHELPRPWMLGGADLVAWKRGGRTTYAVRLEPFRAAILRLWLSLTSNVGVRMDGSTLVINEPDDGVPFAPSTDIDEILQLVAGLPEADVLFVQRSGERGAFPPIGRPAATLVRVGVREITAISRAQTDDLSIEQPIQPSFPAGALLSAAFTRPPKLLSDLNRLLTVRLDALLDDGGSVSLYDVDTGTLVPRPRGVIVVPRDERRLRLVRDLAPLTDFIGETRELGDRLVISVDRRSMDVYAGDRQVPSPWAATRWALRLDPARLAPILRRAGDSTGLRIAAPRLHRSARDLRQWLGSLEHAGALDAAVSVTDGLEELRVRVESK